MAVDELRSTGFAHYLTWFLSTIACGMSRLGRVDDALSSIMEALTICERTGERWCIAELHRIYGEIQHSAATSTSDEGARASFLRALDYARDQGAAIWQLRAGTSLAALLLRQGRPSEGLTILQPLYNAVSEGRNRPDAIRAEKLLVELKEALS
jgi:hypothetical protein